MMATRKVLHVGPTEGKGGMSVMIRNIQSITPSGYTSNSVNTHSDLGLFSKIKVMIKARLDISKLLKLKDFDICHVHLTHGFSWFRKIWLVRLIEKHGIPVILHVHSGKFDRFSSGFLNGHVRRNLRKNRRRVVLLEDRWINLLEDVIPKKTQVVRNFTRTRSVRKSTPGEKIKLLHISRNSPIKGHAFSIKVLEELLFLGYDAELDITGVEEGEIATNLPVNFHGWLDEGDKDILHDRADFMLSPSQYEGSSVSVIESLVSGLPVIASPASSETVGEKLTMSLDNPRSWAERIVEFSNPNKYKEIRKYCLKIGERYSEENAKLEWKKIYDSMIM